MAVVLEVLGGLSEIYKEIHQNICLVMWVGYCCGPRGKMHKHTWLGVFYLEASLDISIFIIWYINSLEYVTLIQLLVQA